MIEKKTLHPENNPNVDIYPKTSVDQVEGLDNEFSNFGNELDEIRSDLNDFSVNVGANITQINQKLNGKSDATNLKNGQAANSVQLPDDEYINTTTGEYSANLGKGCTVSGKRNIVGGLNHNVSGSNNNVSGHTNTVTGNDNIVGGSYNNISGRFNTVNGYYNTVGDNATSNFIAGQRNSVLVGVIQSIINGEYCETGASQSITLGDNCSNNVSRCLVMGSHLESQGNNMMVLGRFNVINNDALIIVGNGSNAGARHNLLELKSNGDLYINGIKIN